MNRRYDGLDEPEVWSLDEPVYTPLTNFEIRLHQNSDKILLSILLYLSDLLILALKNATTWRRSSFFMVMRASDALKKSAESPWFSKCFTASKSREENKNCWCRTLFKNCWKMSPFNFSTHKRAFLKINGQIEIFHHNRLSVPEKSW